LKKGEEITGVIEDISFPNKGSFIYSETGVDGETRSYRVSVKGVLPGQKVRVRIIKKRQGHLEGRLLEVIEDSPLETAKPVCAHFYECGGCSYQTVAYEEQLSLKENMVRKLIMPVIEAAAEDKLFAGEFMWEGILPSPSQFRYRNKMEFTFGDSEKDGPLMVGLHRQYSSYDILGIDSCAIVDPAWNEILKYTQRFYRSQGVDFYHKMQHRGVLRNLVVRESAMDGSILVNLVTTTKQDLLKAQGENENVEGLNLPEYVEGLLSLGDGHGRFNTLSHFSKITGVLYTENDSFADAIVPQKVVTLYGDDFLIDEVLGLKFKISPFSFFQTNTKGAEVLYSKVREYAYEALSGMKSEKSDIHTGVIYDLYSGTGTIAQLMAAVADKVYGIEIVEEAVIAARENAKLNRLRNCEFIAGDVLKKLDEVEDRPDLIILDPPRDGVNPKALRKIMNYGVPYIVYVSCKPTSLARDLAVLGEAGYKAVKGCSVDMFPNTLNVETVVLLQKSCKRN